MKLRTLIFWPHLFAGVLAGTVIFVMSVTGALLTYERQLVAWSDNHLRSTLPPAGTDQMMLERLLEQLSQEHSEISPTAITVGAAADSPVTLSAAQRTFYADAYTGRLLGEGSQGVRRTMSEIRAWHRWLAIEGAGRDKARLITGYSNLLFAFIVLSGIYLWFPRKWTWQQIKAVTLFRGGLRGKARDFNWHNVIGAWSMVPLFIVVVSAVPISLPWANALVYRMVGEEPPGRGAGPRRAGERGEAARGQREERQARAAALGGLDDLLARVKAQAPGWTTINVRIPTSPQAPVTFSIDRGNGGQPHLRSTLTLGRRGEIESYETFSDLSLGRRIRNVMRFAHTGEVLGIPGQTVAGIVSAGGGVLVWTGLALAFRRCSAWIARRRAAKEEPVSARISAA